MTTNSEYTNAKARLNEIWDCKTGDHEEAEFDRLITLISDYDKSLPLTKLEEDAYKEVLILSEDDYNHNWK